MFPRHLRGVAPEGLAALSFLTDDYQGAQDKARTLAADVTVLFGDGARGQPLRLHRGRRTDGIHGQLQRRCRSKRSRQQAADRPLNGLRCGGRSMALLTGIEAIKQLKARYCRYLDDKDWDRGAGCSTTTSRATSPRRAAA